MTATASRRLPSERDEPPRLATLLLRLALDPGIAELVLGDLHEEFGERAASDGPSPARRWYWKQALTSSASGRRPFPGLAGPGRGPRRSPYRRRAPLIDTLLHDLRLTLRSLARYPGFTAVAVLTLALGIGATTGVFSLADWLLLRPVPGVADQDRLAFVNLGIALEGGGLRVSRLSYPNFEDLSGRLTQTDGFAAYQGGSVNASLGEDGAIKLPVQFVTASYAEVLGLRPQLGRWFTDAEDDPGAPAFVAVISGATWDTLFASDPDVLGRDLLVNGRPFRVIGVTAEGFEGAGLPGGVGAWLPGAAYPWANHFDDANAYTERTSGGYYEFIARRAGEATWDQVRAELAAAATWLAERYPEDNAKFGAPDEGPGVAFHLYPGIGAHAMSRPFIASTLRLMLGVVSLVLLIACANVANLLLVRGMRRSGEIAVRKSLGAGRLRLLRQQLTEALTLWLLGGIAGVAVAFLLTRFFAGTQLVGVGAVTSIPLNARMLAAALAVALLTGIAFSFLPSWLAARIDAARILQSGSDGSRARRRALRTIFGAAQLAASLTLLVGALLFARTLGNLAAVDPGLDPADITATFLYPTDIGYSYEGAVDYLERLKASLAAHPETTAVSLSSNLPFYGFKSYGRARAAEDTDGEYLEPLMLGIDEHYFDVVSIPVLRGRTFTAGEVRNDDRVMVLNQALATTLFGEDDPLGRTVEVPQYRADPIFYDVVGVVGDTHFRDLTEAPEPTYFTPRGSGPPASRAVVVVKTRPGANGAEILRAAISRASPSLAPGRVEALADSVRNASAQPRMLAQLLSVLALVAALLAAVGLYAMVSTATAQRTFELGVRIALGSSPARIFALVVASTAAVAALGLAAGLFGAWSLSRAVESRLYGVEALDPASWSAAVLLMVVVTFVAALVPARRAARLDPVQTLRAH